AEPVRASGAQRVAPDDLVVVAALLAGSAGVGGVVVVLRLARPGGDDVRRGPVTGWRAGGDVLPTLTAAGVVLVVAAVGPGLGDGGRAGGPRQRRQRRGGRWLGRAANGVVEVEPGLGARVWRGLRSHVGFAGHPGLAGGD